MFELLLAAAVVTGQADRPWLPYVRDVVRESQARFGVPPPAPVILAQIRQESNFNPLARSPVGAKGLMQFMPGTERWVAVETGWGGMDAFNPQWAIRAGVWFDWYLYERVKRFDTDCDRWHFTLSSYNGGMGWMRDRQRHSPEPGSWSVTGRINPGISYAAQRENEAYSPRILYVHQPTFAEFGKTVCR